MRISDGIESVSTKIEWLLKFYPELRDDDTLLFLAYLNRFHLLREVIGVDAYKKLKALLLDDAVVKFESVSRARRKIQSQGLYQGTKRDLKLEEQEAVKEVVR